MSGQGCPAEPSAVLGAFPSVLPETGGRQPLQPLSPQNVARATEGVLLYLVLADLSVNSFVWLVATVSDSAGVEYHLVGMLNTPVVEGGATSYLLL